jgi:hypothetical protein
LQINKSEAVSAKAIHAHKSGAAIAAVAGASVELGLGVSSGGRTILLLVSYTLISGCIFLVSRFHLISTLEASCGFAKPASSVIDTSFKEIPFGVSVIFRNAVKKFVRFRNAVLLDKPADIRKLQGRTLGGEGITAEFVTLSLPFIDKL